MIFLKKLFAGGLRRGRDEEKETRIRANLARFAVASPSDSQVLRPCSSLRDLAPLLPSGVARSTNRICRSSLAFPPGAGRVALLSQARRQMLDGAFARRRRLRDTVSEMNYQKAETLPLSHWRRANAPSSICRSACNSNATRPAPGGKASDEQQMRFAERAKRARFAWIRVILTSSCQTPKTPDVRRYLA